MFKTFLKNSLLLCLFLTLFTILPGLCLTDSYEPDNQAYQAKQISLNTVSRGHSIYPGADIDWQKFTITSASDVTISTSVYPALVYCVVYTEPDDTSTPYQYATSNFPIKLFGISAGTYYLKFYSNYGNTENIVYDYDVLVKAVPLGSNHISDQYETNNSPDMAYQLTKGVPLSNMSLYPAQDIDWFKFTLAKKEDFGIWFDQNIENIQITLYKILNTDNPVTSDLSNLSYIKNSNEYLYNYDNEPGTYYLKIVATSTLSTFSGLTLNFNTHGSESETNNPYIIDLYEPDNSSSQAVGMTPGTPHEHHYLYSTADTTEYSDFVKFRVPQKSDIVIQAISPLGDQLTKLSLNTSGNIYYNNSYYSVSNYVSNQKSLNVNGILPGYYYVSINRGNYVYRIPDFKIKVDLTPSTLTEDIYEPDNKKEQLSEYLSSVQQRTIFPANDHDYVKFTVTQPSDVDIRTDNELGMDLRVIFYNPQLSENGIYLTKRTDSTKMMGLQPGEYILDIYEYSNDYAGDYTLSINLTPTKFSSDILEISSTINNDTFEQAHPIPLNSDVTNLSIYPASDVDWFKFTTTTAQNITIDLTVPSRDYDQEKIQLYFYKDPNGEHIKELSYYNYYNNPSIKIYSLETGTYYIKAITTNNKCFGFYDIAVSSEDIIDGDAWETLNNYSANYDNTWQNATSIFSGITTETHTLHHADDVDWFKIVLPETNTIYDFTVSSITDNSYNTYIYVYRGHPDDGNYTYVYNTDTIENIKSGISYIKIVRSYYYNTSINYALILKATPTGEMGDSREPDDTYDNATLITMGATIEGNTLYPNNDIDWFKFNVNELSNQGSNLNITVTKSSVNDSTYYYSYLYDSNMAYVESSTNYGYNPYTKNINNLSNGTYYLKMETYYSGVTLEAYSVHVESQGNNISADIAETTNSDNTYDNATLLTNGVTVSNKTIHHIHDVDWYKFTVPSADAVADVVFTFTNYPTYTKLFDSNMNQLNQYYYSSNSAWIYALEAGTYYLKIGDEKSTSYVETDYSVTVDWTKQIISDLNEPNETADSAKAYTLGIEKTGLQLHNYDDQDWYYFELTETSAITAGITIETPGTETVYMRIYQENDLNTPIVYSYGKSNSTYYAKKNIDFVAPGKYYINIKTDYRSSVTVDSYSFKISAETAPVIDLELLSVTLTPDINVDVGDFIKFTLQVKNNGETFTKSHYYKLYIDGVASDNYNSQPDPANPETYIIARGQQNLTEEFKAGEVKTIELTWYAEARAHSYKIGVDSNDYQGYDNLIVETNENNNNYYADFPFELNYSDLKITSVSISPDPNDNASLVSNGTLVTFNATVQNWGDSFSKNHWYSLRISHKAIQTVNGVTEEYEYWPWYTTKVSSMGFEAGEEKIIQLQWIGEPGDHLNYEIKADSYGYIQEKNENNNTATGAFIVTLEKSDLVAGPVTVTVPDVLQQGSRVFFDIAVTNNSTAYVDTYHKYELYLDGVKKSETYNYGYQGSETKTVRLTWIAEPGSFSNYEVKVDATNRVPEDNENNNSTTGSETLNVAQCDITVTSLDIPGVVWETATLKDGQEVNFTANVTNPEPGDVTGSFSVAMIVDGETVQRRTVQGLAGNASEAVPFTWTIRGGANEIKIKADLYNSIVEKNESNNEFTKNLADFATPDIQITEASVTPSTGLKDGSEVELIATVANLGSGGTARNFWVTFEIDNEVKGRISIPGLLPLGNNGATKIIKISTTLEAGNSSLTVRADAYNSVGESDELNNTREITLPTIEMPNLKISNLRVNDGLCDGRQAIARFTLSNIGSGDTATNIYSNFRVDELIVGSWSHYGGLAAGATTEIVTKWFFNSGSKKLTATVDPNGQINESNLSDNEMSIVVPNVPSPDLIPSSVGWEPRLYSLNDQITVYAVVKNTGMGRTERTSNVYFYVDNKIIGRKVVDIPLDPGASESVSFSWTAFPGENLKVTVDTTNLINEGEAGELNNDKIAELPDIPLPDLEVQSITWVDPADPSEGDVLPFHAKIANIGKAYAKPFYVSLYINNRVVDSRQIKGGLWTALDLELDLNWPITSISGTTAEVKVIADQGKYVPEASTTRANNSLSKTITINIPAIDFKIESVQIKKGDLVITSSDNVAPGDLLTFNATISNVGPGNFSKPLETGFYIGWKLLNTKTVQSLNSGESKIVSYDWTVPEGKYADLMVMVDPYDKIGESLGGESNNKLTLSLPQVPVAAKPDLQITSVTTNFDSNKTDYKEGDPVTFTVIVTNSGTTDIAGNIPVVMNVKTDAVTKSHAYYVLDGLVAGASKQVQAIDINGNVTTTVWAVIPRDKAEFTIAVDPYNKIDEADDSNNSSQTTLTFKNRAAKPTDLILLLSKTEATVPAGGYVPFTVNITSRLDEAGYIDFAVTGLDSMKAQLSQPRIYAVPGERNQIYLDVDIPKDYDVMAAPTVPFQITASCDVVKVIQGATLSIVSVPKAENLVPKTDIKTGSTQVVFSWRSGIEGTSRILIKPDGGSYPAEGFGDDVPVLEHKVTVSDLTRGTSYTWKAVSVGTGGTYESEERTLTIDAGISFSNSEYEFTVEKDYNQQVYLDIQNNDTVPQILSLSIENTYDDLILGFLGGGSSDYPIPLNQGRSEKVLLALHLQDATVPEYNIVARIKSTRGSEILESTVPVKINVVIPVIDYEILEVESNPVTLVKKFKVTNRGDVITDFNIVFGADIREAVVVTPDVTHYQLKKNETFYFHAIPLLGHQIFQTKFGASNTVTKITAKGEKVTALATNRRVRCSVGGLVKGLGRPRDPGMHKSLGSKSCQILASAIPASSFNAPNGTTPYGAKLPNLNYKAEVKTWHCNNRPLVSVDVPVPPMDVDDDPLYIDFTPSSGWEQKPHDVHIYLNDHLIASYKNQIPSGTKKIEFDPSILKIPQAGIAKNRVDIRTVHMNGGHYVVNSNLRFKMRLSNYTSYVMATSDDEALALAEQNLPVNIQKAPQSITFDPVEKSSQIVEGTPTILKITPKLPNGQNAKQIELWATVLGEKIPFTDLDGDGTYEGKWTPQIPDDQNTFISSKSMVMANSTKKVSITYETKDGETLTDEMDVEESELNVDILTPESGFDIEVGQTAVIKASVTNKDGAPVDDVDAINVTFSSGDTGGGMSGIGGGKFSFTWTPDEANTNYPGGTSITVSASHSEYGTASDTAAGKVSKDVDLEIKSVKHKYGGHFFAIDGVSHKVEIAVEVDWKKQKEPGSVIFRSSKGTTTVKAESLTEPVKHQLDVGSSIGAGGTLKVKAVTADSQGESEWKDVELTITKQIPLQSALGLKVADESSSFKYESSTAAAMEFIKPAMSADTIPKWVPLFGKKPFLCDFIPQVGVEFKSDGSGKYELAWETDKLKKEKDVKIKGKACGAEFQLSPKLDIEGTAVKTKGTWKWGGKVGAEGKAEISKSWPFIFTLGPVPIPCYLKAALSVTLTGMVGIVDFSSSKWQYAGDVSFKPYGRGSLGVGADGVASLEGWVGGGSDFEFGWPGNGNSGYKGCKVHLNAGVTITVFWWDYEWEGIKYEYPGSEPKKSSKASALYAFSVEGLKAMPRGKVISRDYLNSKKTNIFNTNPFPMKASVASKGMPGGAVVGALAETVFPHSTPCLTNVNQDLFLTWVADDSARTALNRTVLKFASWEESKDETGWSTPVSIDDDGTADFHPEMVSFSDNSAVVAWENSKEQFDSSDTLSTCIPKIDISAAVYDPTAKTWISTNISNNDYFDRTPKLSGSKDNLMLTWISNENNDLKGTATKPNKVMYSIYRNSVWTTPAVAAEIKYRISNYDVLYNGISGYIVLAVNTEEPALPDSDLINDEEIVQSLMNSRELLLTRFIGGTWNAIENLTYNEVPDDNPQLVFDGNTAVMVWLKNNELAWVKNFAMEMSEVFSQVTEYSSNVAAATLVQGPSNNFALLWPEASGYSSDIYTMLYDPTHQAWGQPKQLTNDAEAERNISGCFYSTNSIVAVYNRKNINITTTGEVVSLGSTIEIAVPQAVSTDLFMLKYDMGHNLSVKDRSLYITPSNPLPGSEVSIEVTITNNGDKTAENVVVAFYNGDPAETGVEISQVTVSEPMLPGTEVSVETEWTIPSTLTDPSGIRLFVVVDPESVLDTDLRGDNYMSANLVKPDLAVFSITWEKPTDTSILFKVLVGNSGAIDTAATTLELRDATADSVFTTLDIPVLAPGSVHGVTYEWDITSLARPFYTLTAIADPNAQINEISTLNNTGTASAEGNQQDISVVPESYDYGYVALGADYSKVSFRVVNRGSANLLLGQTVLSGTAAAQFKISEDLGSTNVLKPLDSALITVLYSPDTAGITHEAFLDIPSDDPDTAIKSLPLKGIGKADILLHSLVVSPEKVTVKGGETFDLSFINITAQYSDGSISSPQNATWSVYSSDGQTGTVGNTIFSAPDTNRIVELDVSYTVGLITKTARLDVKVVSPQSPVIADLKLSSTRGDLATAISDPANIVDVVDVVRLAFIGWTGNDSDSVYTTLLYWSLTDLVTDSIPRELAKVQSALIPITSMRLIDSSLSSTGQPSSYVWDVNEIMDTTGVFAADAANSNNIYIYAVATDSDEMPKAAGTQIIKAVQKIRIVKPASNSIPEFAFTALDQAAATSDGDSFDIAFKSVDQDNDTLGISFYYHPKQNNLRALTCFKTGQSTPLYEQFQGQTVELDSASEKTATWDVSSILPGSYYVLAKITDNKHESFSIWSKNPVNITHPVSNIAPSFTWVTPSVAKPIVSDGASEVTASFKVSDDDNDPLSIDIYYSPVNFVDDNLSNLNKNFTIASDSANINTFNFTIDTSQFNSGKYYFLARVNETDKAVGIHDVWTRVPLVIDRSSGIEYLTITQPRVSATAGKAAFDIGFKTAEKSNAKVFYGLNGFTNNTKTSASEGYFHLITLDELEPGKVYSFKLQAEILTSGKIYTKDNQNKLYRIGIPASLGAQTIEARYVRGKINHDTAATIKVYLIDKSVNPPVLSKAMIAKTDENGEWAVNIALAVTGTSNESMSVDENKMIRVEIISEDNKYLYFEDLSLEGIEYAKTAFTGLAPEALWASGAGIQLVEESIEHSMPLSKGFNLIALPIEPLEPMSAKEVLQAIGVNASAIYYYSSVDSGYKSYLRTDATRFIGSDFDIDFSTAFFIKMAADGVLKLTGTKISKPATLNTLKGFNMLTVSYGRDFPASLDTDFSAIALLKSFGADGIAVYAYVNGSYKSVLRIKDGDTDDCFLAPNGNFIIKQGDGYFVKTKEDSSINTEKLGIQE